MFRPGSETSLPFLTQQVTAPVADTQQGAILVGCVLLYVLLCQQPVPHHCGTLHDWQLELGGGLQ